MKKVLVLMLFLLMSFSVYADSISIRLDEVDPEPVIPGKTFDISFEVTNVDPSGEDMEVDLRLEARGEFDIREDSTANFILEPGEDKVVTFEVEVDDDSDEDEEELTLEYRFRIGDNWSEWDEKTYIIDIEQEALLDIASVRSDPEKISPGDEFNVEILLKNEGSVTLENIKVSLDLTDVSLPFAPVGDVSHEELDELKKNREGSVILSLVSYRDANPGVYKVPILVEYEDEYGDDYTQNGLVSLIIESEPVLKVKLDESFGIKGQKSGISVKFINKGTGDIKFLDAKLMGTTNFMIVSDDYFYVGDVDSDDFESVSFDVIVSDVEGNKINFPVLVTYEDFEGNAFSVVENLELSVYSSSEAQKLGLTSGGNFPWWIWIVIVVVVILVIRWIRKRRKKKHAR